MSKVENRVQELWDEAVAQGIRVENKESGSVKEQARKNGSSQGIYSSKTIDDYTRIQYNSYGWVAVNDVLTVNELNRFYKEFANTKMLDFKYKKSFDGYYMIPTGDISMQDSKIVFVSGSAQTPFIDRVISTINSSDDEATYFAKEVINCGGELDSIGYLEDIAGKRIFKEYTSADFEGYGTRKKRGEQHSPASAKNTNEDRGRAGSAQKRNRSPKYSDQVTQADTEYLSAVERGDMKTAQKMVGKAARCVMLPRAGASPAPATAK